MIENPMDKCRHDVLSDCPACMQGTIDMLVEAITDLIEAVRRDSDEGGKGISGYTSARVSDARDILAAAGSPGKP